MRFMAATSIGRRAVASVTASFLWKIKKDGGLDFSKPPQDRLRYGKAPAQQPFFSFLPLGTLFFPIDRIVKHKCYRHVRSIPKSDRKTGRIVTMLGHFKKYFVFVDRYKYNVSRYYSASLNRSVIVSLLRE